MISCAIWNEKALQANWKMCKSLFIPNCMRKIICDYLLIIYKWQFLSRFGILRDKRRPPATSTLLDKNLTCEFKRKNSFTLSKSCMKTEQFLWTVKSSLYPQLNTEELDHKAKLTSLRIRWGFLLKCLSSGWQTVSLVYVEKKLKPKDQNTKKRS